MFLSAIVIIRLLCKKEKRSDFGIKVKTIMGDPIKNFMEFGQLVLELLSREALKCSGIHLLSHAVKKARFEEFNSLYWIGFTLRNCSRRFIGPSLARLGFLLSNQELDIDPEVT